MRRFRITLWMVALSLLVSASGYSQPIPPVVDPPIPPGARDRFCVAECRLDARSCMLAARGEARMCATDCADELRAAAEACAADPASEACESARDAAQACIVTCAENRRASTVACRNELRTCGSQCPEAQPAPMPELKDPECVAACVDTLRTCLGDARGTANCTGDCSDLIVTMQETCEGNEESEECALARQAAIDCLRSCRDGLRQTRQSCVRNGEGCVRSCADVAGPEIPEVP